MLVLRLSFSDSYDHNNHMANVLQVNYHTVVNINNHVADQRSSETSGHLHISVSYSLLQFL